MQSFPHEAPVPASGFELAGAWLAGPLRFDLAEAADLDYRILFRGPEAPSKAKGPGIHSALRVRFVHGVRCAALGRQRSSCS